jgi:cysteine synthase A
MTEEETGISRSTPNYHFASAPPTPADDADETEKPGVEAPPDALEFLDQATHDPENPVVLFALEWCEFCWSVRKMFAEYEIPYRAVDLDSVAYQEGNKGGKIRKAIEQRTGLKTIPQVYVGGKHLGGASETFDAVKDGSMQKLLEENNVSWNRTVDTEPYSFLPGWLHKR